ncbi:hypothetical protein [Nocardia callitridis]|uniref:hypothetical protein n=1 Tax=Nocardia callitridis TaxID=648753 RepID=UPI0031F0C817
MSTPVRVGRRGLAMIGQLLAAGCPLICDHAIATRMATQGFDTPATPNNSVRTNGAGRLGAAHERAFDPTRHRIADPR